MFIDAHFEEVLFDHVSVHGSLDFNVQVLRVKGDPIHHEKIFADEFCCLTFHVKHLESGLRHKTVPDGDQEASYENSDVHEDHLFNVDALHFYLEVREDVEELLQGEEVECGDHEPEQSLEDEHYFTWVSYPEALVHCEGKGVYQGDHWKSQEACVEVQNVVQEELYEILGAEPHLQVTYVYDLGSQSFYHGHSKFVHLTRLARVGIIK